MASKVRKVPAIRRIAASERGRLDLAARVTEVPEDASQEAHIGAPAQAPAQDASRLPEDLPELEDSESCRHGFTRGCRVGTNHSAAYRSRSEWIITDDDTDTRVERAAAWRHTDQGAADEEVITEDREGDDVGEDRDAASEDDGRGRVHVPLQDFPPCLSLRLHPVCSGASCVAEAGFHVLCAEDS